MSGILSKTIFHFKSRPFHTLFRASFTRLTGSFSGLSFITNVHGDPIRGAIGFAESLPQAYETDHFDAPMYSDGVLSQILSLPSIGTTRSLH